MNKTLAFLLLFAVLCVGLGSATTFYSDDFTTDTFTDVNNNNLMYVDVPNTRFNFAFERDAATNDYSYRSISIPDDESLNFEFEVITNAKSSNSYALACLSDTIGDYAVLTGGGVEGVCWNTYGGNWRFLETAAIAVSSGYSYTGSTTYNIQIWRNNGSNDFNFTVWDSSKTSVLFSENVTIASNITDYDYIIFSNSDTGAATLKETDYIDDLLIGDLVVPTGYFTISASNAWDSSAISIFSALVNTTYFHTTNGTIYPGILNNDTNNYNITLNVSNYVTRAYLNFNVTSNLAAQLYPSENVNITFRYVNDTIITDEIAVTLFDSSSATDYNVTAGFLNLSLLSPDSYEIRTEAINFTDRKYFFTVTSGSAQNITVYMFVNTTSTELQVFHIRDTTNDDVTGAILRVEKETPTGTNLWSNYAEEITNAEGKSNTFLEKGINNYYRFAVFVNGTTKRIYPSLEFYTSKTNFIAGVSETVEIFIVLEETDITDYYDELYSVTTDMGFVGNDTVWFSWIDAQNLITGAEMIITGKFIDSNLSYVHVNTNTSSATSGNLSFTFTPINNTIYQIAGYILYNDFSVLVESETHSYENNVNVDKNWGLLLAIVILAVVAVLSISFGVLVSSLFTILMLIFTNLVGFTDFPTTVITSLLALVIILFVKFNKGDK